MIVGVMKDYKLKQRDLRASHTQKHIEHFFFEKKMKNIEKQFRKCPVDRAQGWGALSTC
jgi:hypothetical protein